MNSRTKNLILLVVGLQIVAILALLALPAAVQAVPGRYRVALSERSPFLSELTEGVIERVSPIATALPAPHPDETVPEVDISALLAIQATREIMPPTPTLEPEAAAEDSTRSANTRSEESAALEPAAESTVIPTATPTPAVTPTASPTPTPLPERVQLTGMGVIRQTFNNCGPANLTQVLNFYKVDITQAQVASYLKPNAEDRNVSPWQIADYVNEQTSMNSIARSGGTLELIKQFIAAGIPVVVEKGYELPQSGWWGHYLTLYAYDDAAQELLSQDSYLGPWDASGREISYAELEHFWQQFNYTFYVVYSPDQEPVIERILGPGLLDDFTMWNNAASRADQERKADPENAFAWFNLGTSLTWMGQMTGNAEYYQGGAQAFDRARELGLPPRMLWYQFRPYMAYWKSGRIDDVIALADATLETQGGRNVEETYWYKGHALLSQGNVVDARAAYQAALSVNENFYPAQISLDSLNN